jgi:hypothetical protein
MPTNTSKHIIVTNRTKNPQCLEGPTHRLAPLAVLGGVCLLGGWSSRAASILMFPGHVSSFLGGCARHGLVGPDFLAIFLGEDLLDVLKIMEH